MVDKIYVAHYTPLRERKEKLLKTLQEFNIDVTWIECEPTEKQLGEIYDSNCDLWYKKIFSLDYGGPIPWKELTKSEKSIAYKHIKIWEDIVNNKISTALILEDDLLFSDRFVEVFNFNLLSTPKDWDLIFIGNGCNLRIPKRKVKDGVVAYRKEHPASKCVDSYLINYEAAAIINKNTKPFTLPIDFEINYHMKEADMKVYWWEPPITRQGSQCGLYNSEILK
mgnify:CR=1 FL=1